MCCCHFFGHHSHCGSCSLTRRVVAPQEERMLHASQAMMEERTRSHKNQTDWHILVGLQILIFHDFPRIVTNFSFSVKLKTTRTETTTSTMRQTFPFGFRFSLTVMRMGSKQILSTASPCFLRTQRCPNPVNTLAISLSCDPQAETVEQFTNTSFLLPVEGGIGQTVPPETRYSQEPTIHRDARKKCRQTVKDGSTRNADSPSQQKVSSHSHGIRKIVSR